MFEFLKSGGPVMVPIGLCSIIALAAFLERWWSLQRWRVAPRALRVTVVELLRQGRSEDALTQCRAAGSPLARILEALVAARGQRRVELKELAEEAGRREAADLERYTGIVGVVASVAPLLGLFGTVWGMILTFEVIRDQGMGQMNQLAGGISTALVTTFGGLAVGIPALVAHRYLLARVDDAVLELEEAALEVVELLRGDPPAGGAA